MILILPTRSVLSVPTSGAERADTRSGRRPRGTAMDSAHCGLPETDRGDQKRLVLLQGFRVPPPLAPGGPGVPSAGASLLEAGLLAGTPGTAGGRELPPQHKLGTQRSFQKHSGFVQPSFSLHLLSPALLPKRPRVTHVFGFSESVTISK